MAVEVIGALHNSLIARSSSATADDDTCRSLIHLSHLLSTACLHLHSSGQLYQFDSSPPISPTPPSYPSFEAIRPCSELMAFTSASLLVMKDEILQIGLENSSAKQFLQTAFEDCLKPNCRVSTAGQMGHDLWNQGSEVSPNRNFSAIGKTASH